MSLIEWREEFAIGLPEVDHEHRELIAAINRLHGELGPGTAAADVADRIGGIHAGISAHFALEEKSMLALGYGDYLRHKADHERLLDEILDILDGLREKGKYDPAGLKEALAEWFSVHFRTHDARLHHWLTGRR